MKRAQLRVEAHVAMKAADALDYGPLGEGGGPSEVEPGAAEGLAELAGSEEWWARLYVVATMTKHPELRNERVLSQFGADPHQIVRRAAAAVK